MSRPRVSRLMLSLTIMCCFVLIGSSAAYADKYVCNRHEDNTHFGNAASIYVNNAVRLEDQKVTSILVHRTDWAAIAEIGHYWLGSTTSGFYVYGDNGSYNERDLPDVTAGSTHRYWVGYNPNDKKHYFWMDDASAAKGSALLTNMTSSWSCTNAERVGSMTGGDNVACFQSLKFRNSTWGSWSSWDGSLYCDDSDPYYYTKVTAADHLDCVHN